MDSEFEGAEGIKVASGDMAGCLMKEIGSMVGTADTGSRKAIADAMRIRVAIAWSFEIAGPRRRAVRQGASPGTASGFGRARGLTNPPPTMIQARGITRRYGRFTAVRDLDLDVPERVVCGLLGPNGAGKTTTIRMITGMLPPDAGELRVVGHRMPDARRSALARIGYLPESAPSHPEMRVTEYLRFRGRLLGLDRRTIDRGIGDSLDACDLRDVERRLIGQLSKGYRQRVGLAAALLGDPALLVLDEPTVGLDPRQLRDFRTLVRRLAESRTVLLSSHIMQEIEAVADRVVLMHRGCKLADDTVAAFRERAGGRTRGRIEVGAGGGARVAEVFAGLALDPPATTLDDRGHATFCIGGPDRTEMLGRGFAKAGLAVLELHHEQAGLESVFLDLLDREASAEAAS